MDRKIETETKKRKKERKKSVAWKSDYSKVKMLKKVPMHTLVLKTCTKCGIWHGTALHGMAMRIFNQQNGAQNEGELDLWLPRISTKSTGKEFYGL